jgi:Ca2+:H+ antiporter
MLINAVGLVLPTVYYHANNGRTDVKINSPTEIADETVKISRAVAIILLFGYLVWVFYQTKTHDGLYGDIFEQDEMKDADRDRDLKKAKLTMTEAILGIVIALACVSLIAVFLVHEIPFIVEERHISDAFVGLILIPLVEKIAGKLRRNSLYMASFANAEQNTSPLSTKLGTIR